MSDPGRRVALVTGGTRGIGLGIARALASDGWTLALCGVRPLTDVSATIDEFGGRAEYVQADIGSRADRQRLASTVHDRWGALNALVNNAGRAPAVRADILDAEEEHFEDLLRINLQGPYFLTQAIARQMVAQKGQDPSFQAAVVFVTSVSAEMASTSRGEYCVSKAGLAMTSQLFAATAGRARDSGVRSPARNHRHRHDRRRPRQVRRADCRRPRARGSLGPA